MRILAESNVQGLNNFAASKYDSINSNHE